MAATFTAYSPNTYDRGPITVSPDSPGLSGWANRQLSPSAQNAFKLLAPPSKRKAQPQGSQLLMVPAFEDPRSPKPFKKVHKTETQRFLSVPLIEDPRSPKPYKPRAGVCFQELTLHVPRRGAEGLGKALSVYPRSPYPSAPIEDDMDVDVSVDMDVDSSETTARGRWPTKSGRPHPQPSSCRARSLENEPKTRPRPALAQAQHVASPLRKSFLSPAVDSVSVSAKSNPKVKPTPSSLGFDLETQFWESVTLEGESGSAYVTAAKLPASTNANTGVLSPVPDIMFGSKDGQLWSSRSKAQDVIRAADVGALNLLGTTQKQRKLTVYSKGMVASPSPRDPSAAFPSFTAVMCGIDGYGGLAYPPPVRIAQAYDL
ncbi:hypothetical protein C0993_001628 [Termitomyces sp. T159_Od127]|nr:hypothetical protein C0993_001628 [Termitomyces sp. T159_Od127]